MPCLDERRDERETLIKARDEQNSFCVRKLCKPPHHKVLPPELRGGTARNESALRRARLISCTMKSGNSPAVTARICCVHHAASWLWSCSPPLPKSESMVARVALTYTAADMSTSDSSSFSPLLEMHSVSPRQPPPSP